MNLLRPVFVIIFSWGINVSNAQSPGLIVRPPGGGGITVLNPNGDGYSSGTTAGFVSDDIAESEIPYKIVSAAIGEPTGDVATGPSAGFTDIVTRVDGSGFYMYKDATNIYFRLRIGNIINGSKGYTVLIDTDQKMGGSGSYADPNYVSASGNSPGNPGFEYEVSLQTNFQVAVYSIDGLVTPGAPSTYSLATNSQISVALSTDNNNPDYFYDWFVPLSAIGNPATIRIAATTVTAPNSAFQGSRSDIYGINDANFANRAGAWQTVIDAQPFISLSSFAGVGLTCTAAPTISGPIATGSNISVGGSWARLDATKPGSATISLYKNGVLSGTTTVSSGAAWNIQVASVASGDVFYAKALASGETECLESNRITASGCITRPATPVVSCGSLKGISGSTPSNQAGNSVLVYLVPTTTASPTSNLVSTASNLTYPTDVTFAFYTNNCSGGNNYVATGMYMIVAQNAAGCISQASFVCITSGSSGTPPPLSSNVLTLSQPIYPSATSISGTGATTGDILRLYINGLYRQSIQATGSSFSFSGLSLASGDQIKIYSQTGTSCMTQSSTFTVSCFTQAPVITRNSSGNLITGATTITGTSALPGASVQVYKGTAPSGVATGAAAVVASNGNWSVTVPALGAAETYYATQTSAGCTSAASTSATVLTPSPCPTISNNYTDASITVSGTMAATFTGTIRLYQDGALIGSQSITSSTTWSIPVPAGTLYNNGILSATAQATGNTESTGCSTKTVTCTSPITPAGSPTSITITEGQTVSYTVSNAASGNWYALSDNTGVSYATSAYRNNSSSFSLITKPFTTAGSYTLRLSADALTGCPASFSTLSVTVNAVLPVDFLEVLALSLNGNVSIEWKVTNEQNVDYYEVERSNDGVSFTAVAKVAFKPSTSDPNRYAFTDKVFTAESGKVYYRIRQIDLDGTANYSKTVLVDARAKKTVDIKCYPNPTSNHAFLLAISDKAQLADILIIDELGKVCLKLNKRALQKGSNIFDISRTMSLAKGLYRVRMTAKEDVAGCSFLIQ
ncbi:MAG: hypothetical protein ACTHLE_08545 [Agriterribacter sp.]